jgi:hypothetical protein
MIHDIKMRYAATTPMIIYSGESAIEKIWEKSIG